MNKSTSQPAVALISPGIADLGVWRWQALARMPILITQADPAVAEEREWRGTPLWTDDGVISTGESCRKAVTLTFDKGVSRKDSARLFNSSPAGTTRRTIDIPEGDAVDAPAFTSLVRQAATFNHAAMSTRPKKATT